MAEEGFNERRGPSVVASEALTVVGIVGDAVVVDARTLASASAASIDRK